MPRLHPRSTVPAILAVACVTAAMVAGCGGEPRPAAEGESNRRGVVIATASDIDGVNELTSSQSQLSRDVLGLVFLHLFEEQPASADRPPGFAPELAQSWEFSADRTELTVRLRPEIVWSDGTPVTADDVRWTWQAQTSPEVAWVYAHSKESIAEVEVVDPHTVRFHFAHPSASLLADVNEGFILPRHAWGELPFAEWRLDSDWFFDRRVANGPFRLESWSPQAEIVLARNDSYAGPSPAQLERVTLRIVPESSGQLAQLLAGSVDFVMSVPPDGAQRVADHPETDLLAYSPLQFSYICWNTRQPLFSTAEVRRALTQAIDREALVEALWHGRAKVSNSPIVSSVWAWDPTLPTWPHDPAEASRILAAAGWSDSDGDGVLDRDGESFRFELLTPTSSRTRGDAAVMIQAQLARIGVDAQLRQLESNTLIARAMEHDFEAFIGNWSIDTSMDIGYAFHSDSIDGGFNFGSFADPELDRLIGEFGRLEDRARQREVAAQAQRILHRQQPYTFLWEPQRLVGVRRGLAGVRPNYLSVFFHLRDWRFDD